MPLSSVEGTFRPEIGEVDIAAALDAHEPDDAVRNARQNDILTRQPQIPLRTAPALRHPSRTLGLRIFAGAIADGVEDEVGLGCVVGGGGAGWGVGGCG